MLLYFNMNTHSAYLVNIKNVLLHVMLKGPENIMLHFLYSEQRLKFCNKDVHSLLTNTLNNSLYELF